MFDTVNVQIELTLSSRHISILFLFFNFSSGLDEIPPEVWKTWEFDDILLRHCNTAYNQNTTDG